MGKLDHLFAKKLNISKLKTLIKFSISRLSVLRNQRQARVNLARADIVQILNLGNHDRALIRVEQVIKEQNMLNVFVMIEGYCNLLAERINLLKKEKVCPEELKEAFSSLLYASTRCGEFPELIEMRAIFISRFGKEFAGRCIELRNNCGVNPRMVQKLSTRQPLLENRLKMLKEIAAETNIVLKFEQDYSIAAEENVKKEHNEHETKLELSENSSRLKPGDAFYNFTPKMEVRREYKDVADAAQAAYQSASYAAAAARMAVELSKSHHNNDHSDDQNSARRGEREEGDTMEFEVQPIKQSSLSTIKDQIEGEDDTDSMDLDNEMDQSQKRYPLRSEAEAKKNNSGYGTFGLNLNKESKMKKPELLREKRPVSVRTRF